MATATAPSRPPELRASTGNPALDTMLEGGLVAHRPYLIVGPSGTGKTALGLQFLCEGIRRGERVLLVTLEQPPNEIRLDHRGLAPEIDRVDVFDAIPDVMRYERAPFKDIASVREVVPFGRVPPEIRRTPELTSVEVTITALEQMLRSEVQRRGYARIVIDSLTALQFFCMKGFDPVAGAQTFLRFLSDLRTTTLLMVESPLEEADTAERMLARGEIRLFRWELDGVTVRAIGVEKFRGSSHDIRLHPYRIGPKGIDVNLALTISRDTRQIVEPPPLVVPAGAPAPPPTLAPVSEEIRDLIALGVDIAPVRVAVESALDAVRAGRGDAAAQVARIVSVAGTLGATVVDAGPAPSSGTASEAYRRTTQRMEALRVGAPALALPPPNELEHRLESVLAMLGPTASPAPDWPPVALPPAASGAPKQPTPPAPVAPSPSVTAPAPGPARPAPRAAPPRPAPTATTTPRSPSSVPTPPVPAPARPISAKPAPAPEVPAPRLAEPPPLPPVKPAAASRAAPVPAPAASRPTTAPASPASGSALPPPPPLPNVPVIPSDGAPPSVVPPPPSPEAPAPPVAAPMRRRRAAPARKKPAVDAASVPPTAPADATDPAAGPKAKRRTVRRRKAPPVVGATAEPLPETPDADPPAPKDGP